MKQVLGSTFYRFRSSIEVLVWLHVCFNDHFCLWYDEFLRHSWYGCCDIWIWYMLVGWLSEKHSYVWYNFDMVEGSDEVCMRDMHRMLEMFH